MKITEFPFISKFTSDNVMLVDGTKGTKEIFVGDAILAMLHMTSAELHRSIFRGKNLGASVSTEQWARIQDGTFDDLWLGDYWQGSDGRKWRIADFDYWWNSGDTSCTKHHVVIMPDTSLYNAKMNTSNVTTGGYVGSAMYTSNLANAKTIINSMFGGKVMSHREHLVNAIANSIPTAGSWYDSTVELPNEIMIYGHPHFAPAAIGTSIPNLHTIDKVQLALFREAPKYANTRENYWLRDVVSSAYFALVVSSGNTAYGSASDSYGVRPVFALG